MRQRLGPAALVSLVAVVVACGGRTGLWFLGDEAPGDAGSGEAGTGEAGTPVRDGGSADAVAEGAPDAGAGDEATDASPLPDVAPVPVVPCVNPPGLQPGSPWPIARRCPSRAGVTSAVGPATPTLHWTKDAPDADAGALWAAQVFIAADLVIAADGTVYALALPDTVVAIAPAGTTRWTTSIPVATDARAHETRGPATSFAIGVDGTLFAYNGDLTALRPDGTIGWTSAVTTWPVTQVGVSMRLTVGPDGTIYVADAPPTGASHVFAIDRGGTPVWTTTLAAGTSANSSPTIGADGAIVLLTVDASGNRALVTLKPDGTTAWIAPVGTIDPQQDNPLSPDVPPVVGADGTVYSPCGADSQDGDTFCSFTPDGAPRATFGIIPPYLDAITPAPAGQAVYASADGTLSAFVQDGTGQWNVRAASGLLADLPPILDGDGALYVAVQTGKTARLTFSGQSLELASWSTPGIFPVAMGADGTIYGTSIPPAGVFGAVQLLAVGP